MSRGRNVDGWKYERRDLPFFLCIGVTRWFRNYFVRHSFFFLCLYLYIYLYIYIYIYHLIGLVAFRALVEFGSVVVK